MPLLRLVTDIDALTDEPGVVSVSVVVFCSQHISPIQYLTHLFACTLNQTKIKVKGDRMTEFGRDLAPTAEDRRMVCI